jgi:hypothetical protein
MVQLNFCEARKGVMFRFPMRRPHPLTANLLGRTEARRVPASSHPATRDAAKTYVLQELLTSPWRRAFFGQTAPGGRVDLGGKRRIDNTLILAEMLCFLKPA